MNLFIIYINTVAVIPNFKQANIRITGEENVNLGSEKIKYKNQRKVFNLRFVHFTRNY